MSTGQTLALLTGPPGPSRERTSPASPAFSSFRWGDERKTARGMTKGQGDGLGGEEEEPRRSQEGQGMPGRGCGWGSLPRVRTVGTIHSGSQALKGRLGTPQAAQVYLRG